LNRRIVIIGGTGSLGRELVKFYDKGDYAESIVVFSTDPHKQVSLAREVSKKCSFVLGDIRRYRSVVDAIDGADVVVHAAALKHVDLGETNVSEFLAVNVDGANIVADACMRKDIPKVLFISSDKAVEPVNFYGKTKAIGEDIFLSRGFSVIRYGNVVNSNGSFLSVWRNAIESGKEIIIRNPDPTRFYLELCHAVELVDSAIEATEDGLFIPATLRSFSISRAFTLFQEAIDELLPMYGIYAWRHAPLMPGEKQHEVLLGKYENGTQFNDILCLVGKGTNGTLNHSDFSSKTSTIMTDDEIRAFIKHSLQ